MCGLQSLLLHLQPKVKRFHFSAVIAPGAFHLISRKRGQLVCNGKTNESPSYPILENSICKRDPDGSRNLDRSLMRTVCLYSARPSGIQAK